MTKIVAIDDEAFRGQSYTNPTWKGYSPIEWKRDNIDIDEQLVIYTDDRIWASDKKGLNKIAWLFEGRTFKFSNYEYVETNIDQFDYIFTWDKKLLDKFPNKAIFIPYGGSWINEDEISLYRKKHRLSIVASHKKFLPGHYLRHEVIAKYKPDISGIYGHGYNSIPSLLTAFKDYEFTIVIENEQRSHGFTEKIVTPMLCGTVPIYWGCKSIGDFFDMRGIICFDSIEEIPTILSKLNSEKYHEMLPYIKENFNRAQNYLLMENYVAKVLDNLNL